jgi:aspartyl-tRNA synthetase
MESNRCLVPRNQVLRARIASMFEEEEGYWASVEAVRRLTWGRRLAPRPAPYLHKSQVSFSSPQAKKQWQKEARKLKKQLSTGVDGMSMTGQNNFDAAVEDLNSANVCAEFLQKGIDSSKTTIGEQQYDIVQWIALPAFLYIFSTTPHLPARHHSFTESQDELLESCQSRGWKTDMRVYEPETNREIDIAFGWTRIRQESTGD